MAIPELQLDVLAYQEDGIWVAKCPQFDILTSHPDKNEAFEQAKSMCAAHICHAINKGTRWEDLFQPITKEISLIMAMAENEGTLTVTLNKKECAGPVIIHKHTALAA